MKKIYNKPSLSVVSLEGCSVIVTSLGPNQMGMGGNSPVNGGSGEAPRRNAIWDEEW